MSNVTAMRKPAVEHRYLSPEQVCELVPGLSVRRLRELRAAGRGPRYAKPSPKTTVYVEADVRAWLESVTTTTREQR